MKESGFYSPPKELKIAPLLNLVKLVPSPFPSPLPWTSTQTHSNLFECAYLNQDPNLCLLFLILKSIQLNRPIVELNECQFSSQTSDSESGYEGALAIARFPGMNFCQYLTYRQQLSLRADLEQKKGKNGMILCLLSEPQFCAFQGGTVCETKIKDWRSSKQKEFLAYFNQLAEILDLHPPTEDVENQNQFIENFGNMVTSWWQRWCAVTGMVKIIRRHALATLQTFPPLQNPFSYVPDGLEIPLGSNTQINSFQAETLSISILKPQFQPLQPPRPPEVFVSMETPKEEKEKKRKTASGRSSRPVEKDLRGKIERSGSAGKIQLQKRLRSRKSDLEEVSETDSSESESSESEGVVKEKFCQCFPNCREPKLRKIK